MRQYVCTNVPASHGHRPRQPRHLGSYSRVDPRRKQKKTRQQREQIKNIPRKRATPVVCQIR